MIRLLPILILAGFLASPAFAAGLLISPAQLGLYGAPGETVSGVINVSSPREQENRVRVSFGDFKIDSAGKRVEIGTGDPSIRSCRSWMEVDQDQFVSPERGRVAVVVTARVPKEAAGSYWTSAYFEVVPKAKAAPGEGNAPGVSIAIVPRIAIPVIVTVRGTEKYSLQVRSLRANATPAGFAAEVVVENTGNAAVMLSGAMTLERPSSGDVPEEIASTDVKSATSYPGGMTTIKADLAASGLEPSALELHAYLRYGSAATQVVEASSTLAKILAPNGAAPGVQHEH
jgi:hypothetical protein